MSIYGQQLLFPCDHALSPLKLGVAKTNKTSHRTEAGSVTQKEDSPRRSSRLSARKYVNTIKAWQYCLTTLAPTVSAALAIHLEEVALSGNRAPSLRKNMDPLMPLYISIRELGGFGMRASSSYIHLQSFWFFNDDFHVS
jgi:hypothetical protein